MWKCIMCKRRFKLKKELIRHFVTIHDSSKCWYNKIYCKITPTFNPSRKDSFDIAFKEYPSPGNELGKGSAIIYGNEME